MIKASFLPVASQFLNEKELQEIILSYLPQLKKLGCTQITNDQITSSDKIFYFVITGGTEQLILNLQEKRRQKFGDEEVILLAHASHNSLPASLEVLARFQQNGTKGKIINLSDIDISFQDSTQTNIQTITNKKILKGCRIGLVGKSSDWLVASSPSAEVVKKNWGADVITIKMKELKQLYSEVTNADCLNIFNDITSNSQEIVEPSKKDIMNNIKVYRAMKKIVGKYKLNAITIRCFDLVLDLKTTGCFALSKLNDEGVIAGCEGDLVSTMGMLLIYFRTGNIPWMANPAHINLKDNTLWLAHCTVPRCLVLSYKLRSHFESSLGVGIQGVFPKRKVTLLRIGGKNLDKLWQAEGSIVQTGNEENLCRTQVKIKLSQNADVLDLLTNPLGNHLVMA